MVAWGGAFAADADAPINAMGKNLVLDNGGAQMKACIVQDAEARRKEKLRVMGTGAMAGAAAAFMVAVIVGFLLDGWRVRNHERLMQEATATVMARLDECQKSSARAKEILDLEAAIVEAQR